MIKQYLFEQLCDIKHSFLREESLWRNSKSIGLQPRRKKVRTSVPILHSI